MRYNIIFHVDNEPASMNIAVANIMNTAKDVGPEDRDLILVLNGPGAKHARKDGEHAEQIAQVIALGASVRVCLNAMAKFEIAPEDLVAGCEPVPGAILELADLQRKGYAYIKP